VLGHVDSDDVAGCLTLAAYAARVSVYRSPGEGAPGCAAWCRWVTDAGGSTWFRGGLMDLCQSAGPTPRQPNMPTRQQMLHCAT
jgi:hypothetical protein